jgi:hypothetical protein
MNQFFDVMFTLFLGLLLMFVLTVTSSIAVQQATVQYKDTFKSKTDLKLFEKM